MECTQRLKFSQELYDTRSEKVCPEQIGFLGICGVKHPVKRGPNKIGRDPQTCNIVINIDSISRQHAVINILNQREFMLMDLDSANKTKLMDKTLLPYIPHPLKNGDMIQFGDIFGVFRLLEEDNNLPMTQAIDILETPSLTRHVSKLNKAPATTIPESPDVSDRDGSIHDLETQQMETNDKYVTNEGKNDNIYNMVTQNPFAKMQSTVEQKNDDIYDFETQPPFLAQKSIKGESACGSIHNLETQAPFVEDESRNQDKQNIHKMETQALTSSDHNDSIDSIYTANTQIPPSPPIHRLATQSIVPDKEHLPEVCKIVTHHEMQFNLFTAKNNDDDIFHADTQPFYADIERNAESKKDNVKKLSEKSKGQKVDASRVNMSDEEILFEEMDNENFDFSLLNDSQPIISKMLNEKNDKVNTGNAKPTSKMTTIQDDDGLTDCEDLFEEMPKNSDQIKSGITNKCNVGFEDMLTQKIYEDVSEEVESIKNDDEIADLPTQVIITNTNHDNIEDMPTQVITVKNEEAIDRNKNNFQKDISFEDLPTQVIEEDNLNKSSTKQDTCSINIHQSDYNSPFKIPLISPIIKIKGIKPKSKVIQNNIVSINVPDDIDGEGNYYAATQDILEDLCSQRDQLETSQGTKHEKNKSTHHEMQFNLFTAKNNDDDIFHADTQPFYADIERNAESKKDNVKKLSEKSKGQKVDASRVNMSDEEMDNENFDFPLLNDSQPIICVSENLLETISLTSKNILITKMLNEKNDKVNTGNAKPTSKMTTIQDDDDLTDCEDLFEEMPKNSDQIKSGITNKCNVGFEDMLTQKIYEDVSEEVESIKNDDEIADLPTQVIITNTNHDNIEDMPTQVITVKNEAIDRNKNNFQKDISFEDLPTQVIEEDNLNKSSTKQDTCSINIHQSDYNSPFKIPLISPIIKIKGIKPKSKVIQNNIVSINVPDDIDGEGNYYAATQDILKPNLTKQEVKIDKDIITENISKLKSKMSKHTNKGNSKKPNKVKDEKTLGKENKSKPEKSENKVDIQKSNCSKTVKDSRDAFQSELKINNTTKTEIVNVETAGDKTKTFKNYKSTKQELKRKSNDEVTMVSKRLPDKEVESNLNKDETIEKGSSKRSTRNTRNRRKEDTKQETIIFEQKTNKEHIVSSLKVKTNVRKPPKKNFVEIDLIEETVTEARRSKRQKMSKEKKDDKSLEKVAKLPKSILKKDKNVQHKQSAVNSVSSESRNDSPSLKRSVTSDLDLPSPKRMRANIAANNVSLRSTPARINRTQYVLFTAFPSEEVRKKLEKLGAVIVSDVWACTMVLTLQIKRTFKLLCAVGLGRPIVGKPWVQACIDTNTIVDPWLYLLNDEVAEKRFQFTLKRVLQSKRNFLIGYNVSSTPNVMPAADEMKLIVECSGGVWKEGGVQWICVSCSADKALWPLMKKRGAIVVSTEFILGGVLRQKLDIASNRL